MPGPWKHVRVQKDARVRLDYLLSNWHQHYLLLSFSLGDREKTVTLFCVLMDQCGHGFSEYWTTEERPKYRTEPNALIQVH